MPVKLKPGVDVTNLHPKIQDSIAKAERIYAELGLDLVITAGRDGKHRHDSLHYKGQALDLRLRDYVDLLVKKLKNACGPDFDVIAEYQSPHIHLEYDPKTKKSS